MSRFMWIEPSGWSSAASLSSSRGGELVAGVGRLSLGQLQCCHVEVCVMRAVPVGVRAKLASRQQALELLTDGESSSSSSVAGKNGNVGCLEFAGRLDNVDVSGRSAKGLHKGRVVVIAGPTAVGKSRVAIALAKQLEGEIISADSIQVYKGMNVGSAKTPPQQREGVHHHLLDMVSPTEGAEYSASRFCKDARAATELVLSRNRVPIVVGGTCTYLRWYMNGKSQAAAASPVSASPTVSAAIEAEFRRFVSEPDGWDIAVHMLAQAGDSVTAHTLVRNDWFRLRRALQVLLVSGQPWGPDNYTPLHHMEGSEWDYDYDFQCYFLYLHRAELYRWIDLRCEQMIADPFGLLHEASCLLDLGLMPGTSSASRGIGYQEAMEFLVECRKTGGMITAEKFLVFLSAFQRVSRSLVKKQLTWFRSDHHNDVKQFHWIDASQPTDQILKTLWKEYRRRPGYPSELSGSDERKDASYREAKMLKYYEVKNRIFNNSAAIATILRWVKQTQGDRRYTRNAKYLRAGLSIPLLKLSRESGRPSLRFFIKKAKPAQPSGRCSLIIDSVYSLSYVKESPKADKPTNLVATIALVEQGQRVRLRREAHHFASKQPLVQKSSWRHQAPVVRELRSRAHAMTLDVDMGLWKSSYATPETLAWRYKTLPFYRSEPDVKSAPFLTFDIPIKALALPLLPERYLRPTWSTKTEAYCLQALKAVLIYCNVLLVQTGIGLLALQIFSFASTKREQD